MTEISTKPSPETYAGELVRRLSMVETPSATALPELFYRSSGASALHRATLNCLHDWLARYTLREARANSRYYREHSAYAELPPITPGDPVDLSALPVIDRTTVVENHESMVSDRLELRQICHSSGTTGTPLEVYKSYAEVAFIGDYFGSMFAPLRKTFAKMPLGLSFPNVNHGMPLPIPGFGKTFHGGVTDDTLIRDAVRVLRTRYRIPGHNDRISVLSGLEHHILFFTSFLMEQGIDPRGFGLQSVNITGNLVASHWRDFLADAWGAILNDRFTLTEFVGGASRLGSSEEFVLDPQIIGEVVDDDGKPVEEGVGRLVLTGLAPWIQMQPLIRYDTGDLVWRTRRDDLSSMTFRFLGKQKNAISRKLNGKREWLLFSGPLNEILSPIADIRLYDWFANVRVAKDRTIGSLPVMAVKASEGDAGKIALRIAIELRYAPHCFRERTRAIAETITQQLRDVEGTTLGGAMDRGEVALEFDFRPPEGLNEPIVIKI
ncbi:hypothetical protein [Aminobacter sp. SS-2016]|uniref:hypothetical protein n=1 Tax=Aminobacter sp. Y103A TaxID=1870862 RepID=UPI0025731DD2|nr:hypothetical protein [Aminobacter sp. SS-2016]